MGRSLLRTLAGLVCATVVASTAFAAPQSRPSAETGEDARGLGPRYRSLVDAYASGDDRSVEWLLAWEPRDYMVAATAADRRVGPEDVWELRRYAAAALLHTDAALRLAPDASTSASFNHLDVAGAHLARGVKAKRPGVAEWARYWYFVVTRLLRSGGGAPAARALLELGRDRLPADPIVLLESGALEELFATFYATSGARSPVSTSWAMGPAVVRTDLFQKRAASLGEAAKWIRQSLAIDPRNNLSRLHLGRVLSLRFEDEDALLELAEVARVGTDPALVYLAHLFTAAIHQRIGKPDQAVDSYRAAIVAQPEACAAYFGLSEVLQRTGKGDESREILATVLGLLGPRDPYWPYQFDDLDLARARLTGLRTKVRQ